MPTQIKTQCHSPGCSELVATGHYCKHHARHKTASYHTKTTHKFYNSSAWKRLSRWWRMQEPLCRLCGKAGTQVDHKQPLAAQGDPMAVTNLQTLCDTCHAKKTRQEAALRRF